MQPLALLARDPRADNYPFAWRMARGRATHNLRQRSLRPFSSPPRAAATARRIAYRLKTSTHRAAD